LAHIAIFGTKMQNGCLPLFLDILHRRAQGSSPKYSGHSDRLQVQTLRQTAGTDTPTDCRYRHSDRLQVQTLRQTAGTDTPTRAEQTVDEMKAPGTSHHHDVAKQHKSACTETNARDQEEVQQDQRRRQKLHPSRHVCIYDRHARTHVCLCVCLSVCLCIHTSHICIHIYIHTYTNTQHTYTHTYST
jgi:hypothetical protein